LFNSFINMNISFKSISKVALVVLAFWISWKIWDILAGVFLALVFASVVEGGVGALRKIKIPRIPAVILIYLTGFAVLYFAFYSLIPPLVNEIGQFSANFPKYFENFLVQFEGAKDFFIEYGGSPETIQDALEALSRKIAELVSSIPMFLSSIFGGLATAFLIITISFFLCLEKGGVEKLLGFFTPKNHRESFIQLLIISQKKMQDWFRGRIFSAVIVGTLVYLGLWLMGAEYRITLSLVAALFEIFPVIGPWLAGIIGAIVVSLQSLYLGFFTAVLYAAAGLIEGNLITPIVMRKIVGINPIIVIIVLFVGARLGGILGILIAIPLTAIIIEVINDFRKKRGLESLRND